ncbi:MAG TPA: alanyl-tRNA editing protein [Thermoplasmata archaeon]|nr:alanyl-tRNA editing protein [Thermoplasmata archaeon]
MTELAYLADIDQGYVREFRARVVALPPGALILDRTYFYPTGGGQPADRGTIVLPDGARLDVVDVAKSGPSVVHRVRAARGSAARPAAGDEVVGTIDWERRHRHMRLHTGQHLLSARVFERTGRRTRKATMSGRDAVLELDGPLDDALRGPLGDDLADAVARPRPVAIRHVTRAEWDRHPSSARSGLVPLPPQVDPVRVIEIDGLDSCPCGGTHLRSTGEIGPTALAPVVALGDGGSRLTLTIDPTPGPSPPPG